MINRSASTIVIKRVDVHVQAVWKVPEKDKDPRRIRRGGLLNSSASYDLTVPDRAPPLVLSQPVAHVLKAEEADRFRIVFFRPAPGNVALSMIAKVVHGSESFEESSGELLCVFRDYMDYGYWDADAQRTCIQLAREIRERNGHMSNSLLELLEEMEVGGR
jgi:hypothetical protein